MGELRTWCELGYQFLQECDQAFSEWFAVPRSIKTTSIKPSGTVSLLAGATPGIHFPESRCAFRWFVWVDPRVPCVARVCTCTYITFIH